MSKQHSRRRMKFAPTHMVALGILSVVSSFAIGIQTAGDVQTVGHTEANDLRIAGDMNLDGKADVRDAVLILEVVRGYEAVTTDMLLADPDGDGELTIDDAIRILNDAD